MGLMGLIGLNGQMRRTGKIYFDDCLLISGEMINFAALFSIPV
jgi:hypothetical protein